MCTDTECCLSSAGGLSVPALSFCASHTVTGAKTRQESISVIFTEMTILNFTLRLFTYSSFFLLNWGLIGYC